MNVGNYLQICSTRASGSDRMSERCQWKVTISSTNPLLVGGLKHFLFFHFIYGNNHPNWLIFFKMVIAPPTRLADIWLIFHNIWDDPFHWLSYFSEGWNHQPEGSYPTRFETTNQPFLQPIHWWQKSRWCSSGWALACWAKAGKLVEWNLGKDGGSWVTYPVSSKGLTVTEHIYGDLWEFHWIYGDCMGLNMIYPLINWNSPWT